MPPKLNLLDVNACIANEFSFLTSLAELRIHSLNIPKALVSLPELIKYLDSVKNEFGDRFLIRLPDPEKGEGTFRFIRLKYLSSSESVKKLKDLSFRLCFRFVWLRLKLFIELEFLLSWSCGNSIMILGSYKLYLK